MLQDRYSQTNQLIKNITLRESQTRGESPRVKMVPGIESRWGHIFRTRPDRSWTPLSLLYNGYRVSFPGVNRPGHGVNHPCPSSVEVKERVQLHLYSPSGPSFPVLGRNLSFTGTLWFSELNYVSANDLYKLQQNVHFTSKF